MVQHEVIQTPGEGICISASSRLPTHPKQHVLDARSTQGVSPASQTVLTCEGNDYLMARGSRGQGGGRLLRAPPWSSIGAVCTPTCAPNDTYSSHTHPAYTHTHITCTMQCRYVQIFRPFSYTCAHYRRTCHSSWALWWFTRQAAPTGLTSIGPPLLHTLVPTQPSHLCVRQGALIWSFGHLVIWSPDARHKQMPCRNGSGLHHQGR